MNIYSGIYSRIIIFFTILFFFLSSLSDLERGARNPVE